MKHFIDTLRIINFPVALILCLGLCELHPIAAVAVLAFGAWQLSKVDPNRIPE